MPGKRGLTTSTLASIKKYSSSTPNSQKPSAALLGFRVAESVYKTLKAIYITPTDTSLTWETQELLEVFPGKMPV
ncbi:hypothetical protein EC957_004777 [Mortierella hygrophila]|uniref:Uncharacterized protein n=1 Tax=Mortierella hygrophila TaxID=979708 RepID=A0A9P6K6V5_9FUNG|nr:hypothetical protein EC957_004777 [Mortierella hygrophila]